MPAIVEFPTVVKEVGDEFAPLFANEPERRHFAEYLTHKDNLNHNEPHFLGSDANAPPAVSFRSRHTVSE